MHQINYTGYVGLKAVKQSIERGIRSSATKKIWLLAGAVAILGLRSSNPALTATAVISIPAILQLVWQPGEPPVLAFACLMQWLQATAAIFYTNYYGASLEQSFGGPELETASWLSLVAVLIQAVGMRVALLGTAYGGQGALIKDAAAISLQRVFVCYLIWFAVAGIITSVAFSVSGLTQALLPLAAIKWVLIFLLCYCAIVQKRHYALVAFAVLVEFFAGFLGTFSNFKSVFYVVVVAVLASPLALRGRRLAVIVATVVVLFISGVCWTAIKHDYRQFLAEGIRVGGDVPALEQRVTKLGELFSALSWENLADGLDALILRVSYVNYFALSIRNVPSQVPYENGALWLEAVEHVSMPRLLFPNKPKLYDSERTMMYTGVEVAGSADSTSIGIGYVGESYIDFGPAVMFIPIFLLGVIYGIIYRCFAIKSRLRLLGCAIATAILVFGACTIETASSKLLGGNVSASLVLGAVYLAFGGAFWTWLRARST
jgi:hypothetical protein